MALTATPQSALPPVPSWDETIVPALRKRLEGESLILAKRMSAASLSSLDESPNSNFSTNSDSTVHERNASPTFSLYSQKGHAGAVPRSALKQAKTTSPNPNTTAYRPNGSTPTSSKPPPLKRSRTYSQPYSMDSPPLPNGYHRPNGNAANGSANNAVALPTPESSRSTSPMYQQPRTADLKPTRIPTAARGRTPSGSSHGHTHAPNNTRNDSYTSYKPPTPEDTPHLWAVDEADPNYSRSTMSITSQQRSGIINEQAPFNPGSATSSSVSKRSYEQYTKNHPRNDGIDPSRISSDSEERPFEHWYRGEVSRNGGVGELRVGKRLEMLEIANYGHAFRKATQPSAYRAPSTQPAVNHADIPSRRRRRADSIAGIGSRESFYMDAERAKDIERVLDESPLTDMDGEGDTDADTNSAYHSYGHESTTSQTPPAPPPPMSDGRRSATPTASVRAPSRQQNAPPTRIPGPASRQSSDSPRAATPTMRGTSEPPSFPSSSSSPPTPRAPTGLPRSASQPSKAQPETPKRRAKSPIGPTPKKAKTPKKAHVNRKVLEEDKNRKSVAEYPSPEGEDIVDAIPSWTQPVRAGNWDEVVLPVVARKKGLDGHYEQADGSPQPKKPESTTPAPAPGTFGFDHSKYRSPGELIPMDEFGQHHRQEPEENVQEQKADIERRRSLIQDDRRIRAAPSPAPFAHYGPGQDGGLPILAIPAQVTDAKQPAQTSEEDDGGAGCCKCVIM